MQVRTAAAVAGVTGFASMCLELTAVRLLAPHFGDSAYVWTNVIGVILAALALGAWLGGRLADRGHGRTTLATLFVVAAVLCALAPVCGPTLGAWLLPQDLRLDAAMPAMVRGSLAAAGLLFGLPVFLLGAIAPVLVTLVAESGSRVGRAVGLVSAAGTIGSLLGTFLATHLLVPTFGCRATMWVCALVLAVGAALVRPSARPAASVLLVGLGLLLQHGPLRAAGPGLELLAEAETSQQYLQVVRDPANSGGAMTALKINEGLDSFHSVSVANSVFTGGRYYDYHALAPLLAGDGRRPEHLRALSIGDAAGTFRRIYDAVHPDATVDAVEIDPGAIALGERWFLGRKAPGRVFAVDGRVFIDRSRERWHVIHVDAYAHQIYVPAHLASREFFAAARERLLPGGVLTCNVGGLHFGDPVLQSLGGTLAAVFGEAWAF
ncbi:MAG TPA: fused MFS/spermidine synthase, partial [Planctomycetota bacterium]|nr:fused MFS/spermidine synthase [Planctomycetota bacterium]